MLLLKYIFVSLSKQRKNVRDLVIGTCKYDFPYPFKKIIVRYKKIGYNIDALRQTACLVVNPIKSLTTLLTSLIARR